MASRLQGASLADVRFSIKAFEAAPQENTFPLYFDSILYQSYWSGASYQPKGDYTAGRIDTFDGTACEGTSSYFTAWWMENSFWMSGGSVAASWATMVLSLKKYWCDHQNLSWDGGVKYSPWDWVALTDKWKLRPGDVAVLQNNPDFPDELGESYHYIAIHRVGLQSGVWYATSNKGAGDELGYYEELQDGAGLIGCFRYNGSVGGSASVALGGTVCHTERISVPGPPQVTWPPGLYWPHGTKSVTMTYWYGGQWITITTEVDDGGLIKPMTNGSLTADIRFTMERDDEGHATVSSYVDGELMRAKTGNWVVPVESMISILNIYGEHPWESLRISNVEATVWLCGGGGETDDRRMENSTSWIRGWLGGAPYVLSANKLTPDSMRSAKRDWSKWFEYFEANPLQPQKYTRGNDLFGAVRNRVITDVREAYGVPNAVEWCNGVRVDSDGYVYANAAAIYDPRGYDNYGMFVFFFYATCRGNTVAAVTDRAYRTKLAWVAEGGSHVQYRLVEQPSDPSAWGEIVTVFTGNDCRHPALAAYDDGVVTCWYMADDSGQITGDRQRASISTDDGRTWQELTGMMGSSLRNVSVCQHHGITLGVGVLNSQLFFVRSNDQGRTQDLQPNGETQQLIGACGSDCRPAITWYPDGEVAVWAEDADGETITYHNTSSGYATWTVVP